MQEGIPAETKAPQVRACAADCYVDLLKTRFRVGRLQPLSRLHAPPGAAVILPPR